MKKQWWCVEVVRGCHRREFVGRWETTKEEVHAAFPYSVITGNLVTVFSMAKRG